jgi:hypothetical protein
MGPDTQLTITYGFLALVGGFILRAVWFGVKQRDDYLSLKRKVDTMWTGQLRRGHIEAERSKVLVTTPGNVPDLLNPRVRELFDGIKWELREAYRRNWRALSIDDLMLEIEDRFGARIVEEVCRPLGLIELACLHAAVIVCREEESIERVRAQ